MSVQHGNSSALASTFLRHEYVDVAGQTAPMIVAGKGDVRFVWLPALMDGAASFTRVALDLAAKLRGSVSVCAVDPPGYGNSGMGKHERIPTFAELGVWINALLDRLPGPFILAGNSSGAVLGAAAAANRSDVLGLALVGWCDWRLVGTPHRDLLCPSTLQELQHLLQIGWHRPPRPFSSTLASQLSYARREDYRVHVHSFSPEAFGAAFDRHLGPLALITGTSDGIITPAMVSALAAQRPHAFVRWIAKCGHYPHREQPRELTDILTEWAATLLPEVQRDDRVRADRRAAAGVFAGSSGHAPPSE